MAAIALPLIKPILDAVLAASVVGAAAKTTKDVAEKIKEEKHIKDTSKALSEKEKKDIEDKAKVPSDEKAEEKEPEYKTLSKAEKDELMITLVEGGLSTREVNEIMKTGYISDGQLKRLPVELRRKLARMTGQDLEAQLGFGGMGPDDDDDNDKDKNKKDKKKKLKELKEKAEKEQREWKDKEEEFKKNDPKIKRRVNAKEAQNRAHEEKPFKIKKNDPNFLGNTPEQKMQMGEARMKHAIEHGTGPEWEYQHVTPTSDIPIRP